MTIPSSILAWNIPWTENSWQAAIHVVTKSWTQQSDRAQSNDHLLSYYFCGLGIQGQLSWDLWLRELTKVQNVSAGTRVILELN